MDTREQSTMEVTANAENARVGYQTAISLWVYTGGEVYSRFNVIIVVNSIFLALLGILISGKQIPFLFALSASVAGFFICIIWLLHNSRNLAYANYYILCARELEERFLANTVNTVSRGGHFGNGEPVTFQIDKATTTYRMNLLGRLLRGTAATNIIILLFLAMYSATIFVLLSGCGVYVSP